MKVLHTSDWHIGRKLYNKDIKEDFSFFFSWLIELINREKIDVLVIAGDIFDLAYPSNESLNQYFDYLKQLHDSYCKKIIITSGNHDSVSTLNAPKNILRHFDIIVVGKSSENIEEQIIEIKNEENKTKLVICAIPYLRDTDIRKSIAGESYEDKALAIKEGIINYYKKFADKVKHYKEKLIPVIATGHFFLTDSKMDDAERELYIGSLQQISSRKFPEIFDYFALGHIHRPQIVGNKKNVRYSGSPLPMSFSERNQQKSVVLIDFSKEIKIRTVNIPKCRDIILFKGNFEKVKQKISEYKIPDENKTWAEIEIIEELYNPELKTQAEEFIEEIDNIEILSHKIIFRDKAENIDDLYTEETNLKNFSETDIFDRLLEKTGTENKQEIKNTFLELLELIKK